LSREPGTGSRPPRREPVTAALQAYADRGVFRGFQAAPAPRGRIEYRFLWLTKQPMTAMFDAKAKTLAFPSIFPRVDRRTAAELKAVVDSRAERLQPAHKRIDARKARITATMRQGDLSVATEIRGANHEYAVSRTLNVINELFVTLHEHRPEYLVEQFGVSAE
jgi:hypothetical protein